jgi:hypothetical protein
VAACDSSKLLRILAVTLVVVVLSSGLLQRVSGVDLLQHMSLFPHCVFRSIAGLPCPGCGMTRALLLLGQLRLAEAVALHPLSPGVILAAIWLLCGSPGVDRLRPSVAGATAISALSWAGVALVVGLWLHRMLEGTAPL